MRALIRNLIPPLSRTWLRFNAKPMPVNAMPELFRAHGMTFIYHVTSLECARSIFDQRVIWGRDANRAAHFHFDSTRAQHQAMVPLEEVPVRLGFSWNGPAQWGMDETPGVLHQVPTENLAHLPAELAEAERQLWELRLYPGTSAGLSLVSVDIGGRSYALNLVVPIGVVEQPADTGF